VESLLQIAGVEAELQLDKTRLRPVEQRRMAGDPGKLSEQLGWAPEISLERTLTDLLNEMEMTHHN
jgi:GDP-4-dehydro-6-deoxy-D-mannose reductase